jgi:general secretion pathway protein N
MTQATAIQVRAGWSTVLVKVSDHTSQWPAALLTGLGAPWNTLQPDGQLHLRTASLEWQWAEGRMQMKGLTELRMQNMASRLSAIQPIGSYQLQWHGTPEGTATPSLQLSTLQGPLLLKGEGQWIGARLRFTGEAQAQEGYESALNNLLNILGRRQGLRSLLSLG